MPRFSLLKKILVVSFTLAFQSCGTSSSQRSVDEKLAAEPAVTSQNDSIKRSDAVIDSAPGLTEKQRNELNIIRESTRVQAASLEQQALKLRQILIKELVATDYNSKNASEVRTIKYKLSKLQNERLNLTFEAIEKAQKVLGHEAKNNQTMMHHLFDREIEGQGTY